MKKRRFTLIPTIIAVYLIFIFLMFAGGKFFVQTYVAQIATPFIPFLDGKNIPAEEVGMCDAFSGPNNGGFMPQSPLTGSATIIYNNGNEVHVYFQATGPTLLLPAILADLRTAATITRARASSLCREETWEDKPCNFEVEESGTNVGLWDPLPHIKLSGPLGMIATASGVIKYKCECDETPPPPPPGEPGPPPTPQ